MVRIMYPKKLISMYPRTPLSTLRNKGYIKYVNGKPTYTKKGLKHIRK